jgi:hypothetical protein
MTTDRQPDEGLRDDWVALVARLNRRERRELRRELRLRLRRAHLLHLRQAPTPVVLGVIYSFVVFLLILAMPVPVEVPIFIPLALAAAGSLAVTLFFVYDLALRWLLHAHRPHIPPFQEK